MSCKTLAAEENVQKYLDSIEQADASLNSYITVDREGALSQVSSLLMIIFHFNTYKQIAYIFRCIRYYLSPNILLQAKSIDRRVANGEDVGPLAGVPMAIKVS